MRALVAGLLMATFAYAATPTPPRHSHVRTGTRLRRYRRKVVNKNALIGSGANAAFGTARNRPHEWGRGPVGAAKRFGSSLGQHVAKESIQLGVAAARHENPRYQRSNKRGTLPRMGYAVKHTFIVPKTNKPGKKTVALGRISGNMGAGMLSRAWQPASAAGLGAGLASGGIGLGADVGMNMAREFWPRKRPTAKARPRRRAR